MGQQSQIFQQGKSLFLKTRKQEEERVWASTCWAPWGCRRHRRGGRWRRRPSSTRRSTAAPCWPATAPPLAATSGTPRSPFFLNFFIRSFQKTTKTTISSEPLITKLTRRKQERKIRRRWWWRPLGWMLTVRSPGRRRGRRRCRRGGPPAAALSQPRRPSRPFLPCLPLGGIGRARGQRKRGRGEENVGKVSLIT